MSELQQLQLEQDMAAAQRLEQWANTADEATLRQWLTLVPREWYHARRGRGPDFNAVRLMLPDVLFLENYDVVPGQQPTVRA